MRLSTAFCFLAATLTQGLPTPKPHPLALPPYYVLTGDSTTAVNGGWGDGLLGFLQNPTGGVNLGKSGATTASFKAGGYWTTAINTVKKVKGQYQPIVTIQFGHNDQKDTSGISLSQFQTNMENLAKDVLDAGGTPVRKNIPIQCYKTVDEPISLSTIY